MTPRRGSEQRLFMKKDFFQRERRQALNSGESLQPAGQRGR